jgi:hypothetical protein
LKRVIISATTKAQKNQNPVITSLNLNDSPVAGSGITTPTSVVNFSEISPPGSTESYPVMNADGSLTTQTETLETTWFQSDATSFQFFRTVSAGENPWTPPGTAPVGRGMVILAVTRDGRGGEAFLKLDLD